MARRASGGKVPLEERTDFSKIEVAFDISQTAEDSQRCFSCRDCLTCDNCRTLCPDNVVVKTVEVGIDGSHYVCAYD